MPMTSVYPTLITGMTMDELALGLAIGRVGCFLTGLHPGFGDAHLVRIPVCRRAREALLLRRPHDLLERLVVHECAFSQHLTELQEVDGVRAGDLARREGGETQMGLDHHVG